MRDIKTGDILYVFDRKSFISHLIWFFSSHFGSGSKRMRHKVSHVAMVSSDTNYVIEADWKGVKKTSLSQYFNKSRYSLRIGYPNGDEGVYNSEKRNLAANYAISKLGLHYPKIQIFAIAIKKLFGFDKVGDWDKSAMICSELVLNALDSIGVKGIVQIEYSEATPVDILNSEKMVSFAVKYEGKIYYNWRVRK